MASPQEKLAFSNWKYRHYFNLLKVKGKNVHVKCSLCPRAKCLSTSVVSNSNPMKHLSTAHASAKSVAKNIVVDTVDDDMKERRTWALLTKKDTEPFKQQQLDFSAPASQKLLTQTELNAMIGRYVVENMLLLSAVDSDSPAEKNSTDHHQNTTYAGLASDWSPSRCWVLVLVLVLVYAVFFSRVHQSPHW